MRLPRRDQTKSYPVRVPHDEGEADKMEELLRSVPLVQGVEFVKMSRVI